MAPAAHVTCPAPALRSQRAGVAGWLTDCDGALGAGGGAGGISGDATDFEVRGNAPCFLRAASSRCSDSAQARASALRPRMSGADEQPNRPQITSKKAINRMDRA